MVDEVSVPSTRCVRHKNFIVILLTFLCIYTPYNAVVNIQSSINVDENVGLYSLAISHGCTAFACLFLTNPLIFLAGYKWTIFAGQVGFLLFIGANLYPKTWIMFPAAALCGLVEAGLWVAQSAYIADLVIRGDSVDDDDKTVNKYFGIFFSAFQSCEIWGNLISYLVLHYSRSSKETSVNVVYNFTHCGASFWQKDEESSDNSVQRLSNKTMYILLGILIGIVVFSIIFVPLFLDQRRKLKASEYKGILSESFHYGWSTLKQMTKLDQILIFPLAFWIGCSEAFTFGIFTNSFITCALSVEYVGLVLIAYGAGACLVSVFVGFTAKSHIRPLFFLLATLLSGSAMVTMLVWNPQKSEAYVLYILSSIMGVASAIWDPIESALYENLFPTKEERAFSTMWLAQNTGYLIVYMYASSLRVRTSIILQLVYLTVAMFGYILLEIKLRLYRNKSPTEK